MRGLEKNFSPVIVNAMSDMEVEAITSGPLYAKRQSEFLENHIKELQDRHKIFRGAIGNVGSDGALSMCGGGPYPRRRAFNYTSA